jgi:hypothetical protein
MAMFPDGGKVIMRDNWRWLVLLAAAVPALPAMAQTDETPSEPEAASPAQEIDVYVFPKKDQSAEQQRKDEAECFDAAEKQSGVDPKTPPPRPPTAAEKQAAADQAAQNAPQYQGAKRRGAVGGAAVGAVGGAIFGHPGAGAAIGAGAGVARGHNRQEQANAASQQQAAASAVAQQKKAYSRKKAAYDKDMKDFKRAFGACLDSRGYSVK